MARTHRNASDYLSLALRHHGARFEYFQVVRMLRLLGVEVGSAGAAPHLRTRAALELAAAAGEVRQVRQDAQGNWQVLCQCFGLLGVTSPLPTYYTEDLLDEQREGRTAARGLIDILHHALYPLLFESWEKYRLAQRVAEAGDARARACLHALAGIVGGGMQAGQPAPVVRNLALLQQGPRSASGLQRMLALALHPARVRVVQHVRRVLTIPAPQRTRLGRCNHRLGHDLRVGRGIDDTCATIRILVLELSPQALRELLPGGTARRRLEELLRIYLRDPLIVQLALQLRADARPSPLRLGASYWNRLGLDAWLARGPGEAPLAQAGEWCVHEQATARREPAA